MPSAPTADAGAAPDAPNRGRLVTWIRTALLAVYHHGYRRLDGLLVPLENRALNWYAGVAPRAFRRRIEGAITRGLAFVEAQPALEISTLVALGRFVGEEDEPRLCFIGPRVEAYRAAYKDPHLRLLDRGYDPDRDGADRPHEFTTASLQEQRMITCIHADRLGLDESFLSELTALEDGGGYGTTHVLFGAALLAEFSTINHAAIAALEASAASTLVRAARTARVDDLFNERVAFLLWRGYDDAIEPAWVLRIALGQLRDGGWYWKRAALRPRSAQHPTCLALAALIQYRRRFAGRPPPTARARVVS